MQCVDLGGRRIIKKKTYLKHWLTKLKEEPAFLVEILGDVNKAAKMIADKVTEPINEPAAA